MKQGQIPRVVFAASQPSVGYACTAGSTARLADQQDDRWRRYLEVPEQPDHGTFCSITVNPTNANDVPSQRRQPIHQYHRALDGWRRDLAEAKRGETAFHTWGWAGSTFLVATHLTENPYSETDLYKSVNGGAFVHIDKRGARRRQLGALSLLGGTALDRSIWSTGSYRAIRTRASRGARLYRSMDGGATGRKSTFAGVGGQVYPISASADGKPSRRNSPATTRRGRDLARRGVDLAKLLRQAVQRAGTLAGSRSRPMAADLRDESTPAMVTARIICIFLARPGRRAVGRRGDPACLTVLWRRSSGMRLVIPPRSGRTTPPTIAARRGSYSRIHSRNTKSTSAVVFVEARYIAPALPNRDLSRPQRTGKTGLAPPSDNAA